MDALRLAITQVDLELYQPEKVRQLRAGKTITLKQAAERYRELGTRGGRPLSPRTVFEYQCYISRDLAHLANKPIAAITQDDVEEWWIAIGDKGTFSLRTKVYSHLKSITGFAIRKGWIAIDPCQIRGGSQSPEVKNKSIPTVEQVKLIIEKAPEEYKAYFAIAAWGGLRKGELLELRRRDFSLINNEPENMYKVQVERAVIWLPRGQVEVRPPKWESMREVLLPPQITALVRAHLNKTSLDPEALLFPRNNRRPYDHLANHKITRIWSVARTCAEYQGSLHSLRSFAGTQYAVAGATLRETMVRLGHSSAQAAMRYQKTAGRENNLVRKLGQ